MLSFGRRSARVMGVVSLWAALAIPAVAQTQPANAVRTNPGFRAASLARNDDGSTGRIPLGFMVNFFGVMRDGAFVNNNGNITFDAASGTFTPEGFVNQDRQIIGPFFADVDTRGQGSMLVTYGQDTVDGRLAFGVNWVDVGYFPSQTDKLNSFQLVLVDRSDTGAGNFDIEFNYNRILWETGSASGGVNGFGGVSASAGYSNGTEQPGTFFEVEGSRVNGAFLDRSPTGLANRVGATGIRGRLFFQARGGTIIMMPPPVEPPPPVRLQLSGTLPPAVLGRQYAGSITATGGTGQVAFALITEGGSLPPGLTLSPDGQVLGIPSAPGTYNFTVTATDSSTPARTGSQAFVISVEEPSLPPISLEARLPDGGVGRSYVAQVTATGGNGSGYSFQVGRGSVLPPGLALSPEGAITGTPTRAGLFRFTIFVTDGSQVASFTAAINVLADPVTLSGSLPGGSVNQPYSVTLRASGGTPPYRFSASGLPPGLGITEDGIVSGRPTQLGQFSVTVTVQDAEGGRASSTQTVTIVGTVSVTLTGIADGVVGQSLTATAAATGGLPPYRFAVVGGSLPPGVSLSSGGTLSGTFTSNGTFSFTIEATDAQGQAGRASATINVIAALNIQLPSPVGSFAVGDTLTLNPTTAGGRTPYFFSSTGSLPPGLSVSSTTGEVRGALAQAGTFEFGVEVRDADGRTAQSNPVRVTVAAALTLNDATVPSGMVGMALSASFSATGGTMPYSFSATGLPTGITVNQAGQLSGTTTQSGSFPFTVTVTDARGRTASRSFTLAVGVPPVPVPTIGGMLTVGTGGEQPRAMITIDRPFPLPLTGTLTLSFVAADNGTADPALQFASGGRTINFTIPAGQTTARFNDQDSAALQTGTVAGTITLTVQLTLNGMNVTPSPAPTQTVTLAPAAPVLSRVRLIRGTGTTLSVEVTGFVNNRQVTDGTFRFTGTNLQQSDFTVALEQAFAQYFTSAAAQNRGSQFVLTLPFTVQGDANAITAVTVTLRNRVGASNTLEGRP